MKQRIFLVCGVLAALVTLAGVGDPWHVLAFIGVSTPLWLLPMLPYQAISRGVLVATFAGIWILVGLASLEFHFVDSQLWWKFFALALAVLALALSFRINNIQVNADRNYSVLLATVLGITAIAIAAGARTVFPVQTPDSPSPSAQMTVTEVVSGSKTKMAQIKLSSTLLIKSPFEITARTIDVTGAISERVVTGTLDTTGQAVIEIPCGNLVVAKIGSLQLSAHPTFCQ